MEARQFDLAEYLKLTGADSKINKNTEPDLNLLTALVFNHVSTVHYQNYELLTQKKILDMTPGTLLQRLIVSRKGGMCYEVSELMFHVLTEFKFDVRRVAVVVLGGMPYDESHPKDHNVLIVYLAGKKYLVDVGFGFNSLRAPIEFNFESTEEKSLMEGEKYQLLCADEYYQLNFWLKGAWASFYRFPKPMTFINYQESMKYYRNLVEFPRTLTIRDQVLFVGVVLKDGRYGFSCDYDSEKGARNFKMLTVVRNDSKSVNMDIVTFRDTIHKYVNIDMKYTEESGIIRLF